MSRFVSRGVRRGVRGCIFLSECGLCQAHDSRHGETEDLAILGALSTWTYNLRALSELGDAFTPAAFVRVGFEGSALLGSLATDFWVGSTASLIWMISEGRRLQMRRLWVYVILTFVIAWAFSLPMFLFMRERRLSRSS